LDTAPLICFLVGDPSRGALVRALLERAAAGHCTLVASVITETELLVAPLRSEDARQACATVQDLLGGPPAIAIHPVTRAIARRAAQVRATWNLRLADALVLATAEEAGCNVLLGNDVRFQRIDSPQMAYVHLDDPLD
jgi:predicted nucleic acid-binding protein